MTRETAFAAAAAAESAPDQLPREVLGVAGEWEVCDDDSIADLDFRGELDALRVGAVHYRADTDDVGNPRPAYWLVRVSTPCGPDYVSHQARGDSLDEAVGALLRLLANTVQIHARLTSRQRGER